MPPPSETHAVYRDRGSECLAIIRLVLVDREEVCFEGSLKSCRQYVSAHCSDSERLYRLRRPIDD